MKSDNYHDIGCISVSSKNCAISIIVKEISQAHP